MNIIEQVQELETTVFCKASLIHVQDVESWKPMHKRFLSIYLWGWDY